MRSNASNRLFAAVVMLAGLLGCQPSPIVRIDGANEASSVEAQNTATDGTFPNRSESDPVDATVEIVDPALDDVQIQLTLSTAVLSEALSIDVPLAIAPFSADQAKQIQLDCGRRINIPIEHATDIGIKLRLIPPGEFLMGSAGDGPSVNSNEPQRRVRITKPFFLGVTEVTQHEYLKVVGNNPSHFSSAITHVDTRQHPVDQVTWFDAIAFCNRLSEREGLRSYYRRENDDDVAILGGDGYRLPTEAEWEYACRAGATTAYYFGDDRATVGEHAWTATNSDATTHRVGQRKANAFGLHEMCGSVAEWCQDYYGESSTGDVEENPSGPPRGWTGRVLRDTAFNDVAQDFRCAARTCARPSESNRGIGFRVARSFPEMEMDR